MKSFESFAWDTFAVSQCQMALEKPHGIMQKEMRQSCAFSHGPPIPFLKCYPHESEILQQRLFFNSAPLTWRLYEKPVWK